MIMDGIIGIFYRVIEGTFISKYVFIIKTKNIKMSQNGYHILMDSKTIKIVIINKIDIIIFKKKIKHNLVEIIQVNIVYLDGKLKCTLLQNC